MIPLALSIALLLAPSSLPIQTQQRGELPHSQAQDDQAAPRGQTQILPPSYLGCWRGLVASPDTLETLNGCEAGPFVPELYTLCYRKTTAGRFELTFSGVEMDTAVPAEYEMNGASGEVQVMETDGIGKVKLHSSIHFEQNQVGTDASSDAKWSMNEQTEMSCDIRGDELEVVGIYTQISDKTACFRGRWHTRFIKSDE
ncbi:MAG TPA: hypothetical protein VMT64_07775 [Candidatus Binataceae bacterium]|nr:hypothetical protein [Candidatus Binataceae bacterium]